MSLSCTFLQMKINILCVYHNKNYQLFQISTLLESWICFYKFLDNILHYVSATLTILLFGFELFVECVDSKKNIAYHLAFPFR